MKKLKIFKGIREMLTKDQMKQVTGGYGGYYDCACGTYPSIYRFTCVTDQECAQKAWDNCNGYAYRCS